MDKLTAIVQDMLNQGYSKEAIETTISVYKNQNPDYKTTAPPVGQIEQPNFDEIIPEDQNWFERNIGDNIPGIEFMSDLYRDIQRGIAIGQTTDEKGRLFTGDSSDEAIQDYIETTKEVGKLKQSEEMQQYNKFLQEYKDQGDSDALAWFKAQAKSALKGDGVLMGMFAESLASQASTIFASPGQAAIVGAGAVAGAKTGGAIGAAASSWTGPLAGVFSAFSAAGGAVAGARSASMGILETTTTFHDELAKRIRENGGDPLNAADIRAVLEDEEAMSEMRRNALARGFTISAFEGAAGLVGAGVAAKTVVSKAGKFVRATKVAGVEAVGGGTGEFAGQLAAGQDINVEEILTEAFTGTGMAATSIAAGQFNRKGIAEYNLNGEKDAKLRGEIEDLVENGTDEQFVNSKVKVENDKTLQDKINKRRKKIVKENKQAVKDKIKPKVVEEVEKRIDAKILKLQQQIKQVEKEDGPVAAAAFKKQLEIEKKKKEDINKIMFEQLDQLSEEETLNLMNMDDEVSIYQSILNDPNSTELAKQSAKEQLALLKAAQLEVVNNPDSVDMAKEDGPVSKKNKDLSDKTQKAYERKGKDAWAEVSEYQAGIINTIAHSMWSKIPKEKRVGTIEDFISGLKNDKEGIRGLLKTYKPEKGVPLAAYIQNPVSGIRVRANRIIKNYVKQDIEADVTSQQFKDYYTTEEAISLDRRYLHEKLKLNPILSDLESTTEVAYQKARNVLETIGNVTQKKQRKALVKAFDEIFKGKYDKKIKEFTGKNTKTEKTFSEFLKKNLPALKLAVVANINSQMSNDKIMSTWTKVPPTDQDFLDYYEGKDISPDQPASVKSDRKTKLVEAIRRQLGIDARASFREQFAEDLPQFQQIDEVEVFNSKDFLSKLNFIFTEPSEVIGKEAKDVEDAEVENNINKVIENQIVPNLNKNFDNENTKKLDPNNENDLPEIYEEWQSYITKGYVSPAVLQKMGQFGAKVAYKDVNGKFHPTKKAAKLGNDKAKPEKYYEMKEAVEGSEESNGKQYLPFGIDTKNPELEGKFKPARGGLYYGTVDPLYKNHLKLAQENYPKQKISKKGKLNLFGKINNVISNNLVNYPILKKLVDGYASSVQNNQEIVMQMAEDMADATQKGEANPWVMSLGLKTAYKGTDGLLKTSYEFKGYEQGTLEFGDGKFAENYKGNSKRRVREEHSPPVSSFAAKLLLATSMVKSENMRPLIQKMYRDAGQYLISFKHDQDLETAKLGASIVEGDVIGQNSGLHRILQVIPANKLVLIKDNITVEELNDKIKDAIQTKKTAERILQGVTQQFEQDNQQDIPLSDNERIEAFTDILSLAYPDKIIMTNKEDVIKYLTANFPDQYPSKEAARKAVENARGFRDNTVIFLNPEKATLETVMHEFTHEWAYIVKDRDPELFNAIYEKIQGHPRFKEAVERMKQPGVGNYNKLSPSSFEYKNEVIAYILGKEGSSLYELFEGDAEAKSLIDKFFDYVREALGFDPTVKNFSDLTVEEVIKLTVKDIVEGNPAANFDKLKNKSEGKSWFAKTEANQSPSQKAKLDPILRAFNKIKLSYRENKDLAQAIVDAYPEVESSMEFGDFVKLVLQNTKETEIGKSKTLLIAKNDVLKANKIAEESTKKLEQDKIKEEDKSTLQNKFRRMIYKAAAEGAKVSRWFIPPSAEDFKGLLYTFLPKGKAGVEARKFLEETLLKPYSDGIAALDTEILNKSKAWEKMSKGYNLNEKVEGTPYTIGDAIKIYNAIKRGDDVTIAKQKHMDALIHKVESDQNLLDLAEAIEESFPIDVKDGWQNKTLAKEVFDAINNGARERALKTFSENVDAIFNDTTMDLIGDQFGNNFKQALKNTLRRMKSGRNRVSTDAQSNVWLNWINRAVGTTMFFNSRSALLQTISSLNFIGLKDNNIFKAAAAYANTKQFNEDYKKLWNSDYLRNRRDGAKFDVLADEIAEGDPKGLNKLLKNGFLPTRYADSFAIALGGAAFYRNRVNALVKGGMDVKQAEEQAMNDWRREAENSQQSADPSKISEIQASSLGRIVYAFANTPFQYARIVKRRLQDITSGRSAAEGRVQSDLGTILYYGAVQAVMFNALQSGLAALAFGDDDDEEIKKLKDKKYLMSIERGLTSFAKSLGNPGAISATLYSLLKEGYLQQTGQKRPDPNVFAITATSISPPINSKLRDLSSAYRSFNKIEEEDLLTPSLDSEALTMSGEVASFAGVPLDRVIRKARHLAAIKNEELELWQKIWLVLGWNEWDLGVDTKANKDLLNFDNVKFKDVDFDDVSFEDSDSSFKKLKPGVAGVANNDGTIELAPDLSPEEKKKTIKHEKQHLLDMKNKKIKLNYDDNFVYYKNNKYKRANGNIEYNGKSYIEGHPDLPWEKRAYKAEKTKKFLYA